MVDNYLRSFMGLDSASAVIQHIEWSKSSFFRKERLEAALEILSKNCLTSGIESCYGSNRRENISA